MSKILTQFFHNKPACLITAVQVISSVIPAPAFAGVNSTGNPDEEEFMDARLRGHDIIWYLKISFSNDTAMPIWTAMF